MAKSKKFGSKTVGPVLAIRKHEDENGDESYHIGYPCRMFLFDIYSQVEFKRVRALFGLEHQALVDFMTEADQHPNEFVLMTL